MAKRKKKKTDEPTIENRKARYRYAIVETMEVGIKLLGTEVKSVRDGKMSLGEGYVRAEATPPRLTLYGVHIAEYPPAGFKVMQHHPTRPRVLLAHKKEIMKLAIASEVKGTTIVPLKVYFKGGRAKLQIGVGKGKGQSDKRQDIREREDKRAMERAMSKKI